MHYILGRKEEVRKESEKKDDFLTSSTYLTMPRSVLPKSLSGSQLVVVVMLVMSFHQTKFTQHEQLFIQDVHQLTRKEGYVHRSSGLLIFPQYRIDLAQNKPLLF